MILDLKDKNMTIINSNVYVYIEILNYFSIPFIENLFGNEVIYQDNNETCHRQKELKLFLPESYIKKINDMASKVFRSI